MNSRVASFVRVLMVCGVLLLLALPATAGPVIGTLQLGGTFTVGGTFVNFCTSPPCPSAPGNWSPPGSGTGDLSNPYANDPNGGTILNLDNINAPVGALLPGHGIVFLTFAASGALPVPDIEFYITQLFAGGGGTAQCGAAPAPGQTCTLPGSSATLLNLAGGTSSATIAAAGLARRISTNEFDPLQILLTSNFDTPFQVVLGNIQQFGTVSNTYQASFTAAPEPVTLSLIGFGLFAMGAFSLRKAKK